MKVLSKVCDGADWFDPELQAVIDGDLRELPRFHRKQWEFAMILLALRRKGVLRPDAVGLSMGAGKERLLYAVAHHVRQVVATDLYGAETEWDTARSTDPDRYIKEDKPFPVDDAKLRGLRMDMRSLDFEGGTFDFCYSSCAIEHIGARDDFLKHFSETHRVLKEGGVYALTTELHYGPETLEHPHNYYFSPGYLRDLIAASPFVAEPEIDARIAHHRINYPLPQNLATLCFEGPGRLVNNLLEEFPHVQLLLGRHPFTSLSLVLKKDASAPRKSICFPGLEESREFLGHGVAAYRDWIEQSRVTLNPFAFGGKAELPALREGDTVFHTDYEWFGSAPRTFRVSLGVAEVEGEGATLDLMVHRAATLEPAGVACIRTQTVGLTAAGQVTEDVTVDTSDRDRYAFLGRLVRGSCRLDRVTVEALPGR